MAYPLLTPVLYIEETLDDSRKDWHLCIRYGGDDTYVVYGYRYNCNNDFYTKMLFLNRHSLVKFLLSSCDISASKMDATMYFVNQNQLENDDFESYYTAYRFNNELFGYDRCSYTEKQLMDWLQILRDVRM
jgi:hypothetical protein